MRVRKTLLALAVVGAAFAGCSEPAGVSAGLPRPGVLQVVGYQGTLAVVERDETVRWSVDPEGRVFVPRQVVIAPDTVVVGQPFDVTVTTIGLSGCWRAEGQVVGLQERVVEMTPRDVHSGADVCTDLLLELTHTSALMIASPGEWVLRVSGRRVRHGDATWEEPVAAERTIVVRR